jgi:2'-5' RNA ligase
MSRANWFIGLPIIGMQLDACMSKAPSHIRVFDTADLHLTIAFLGPTTESSARIAWNALDWPLPSREVSFGKLVPMGNPRHFSALSVLLDEGRAEVEVAMGRARKQVCAAAGVAEDERPPKAHITLARVSRRATDRDRIAALSWAEFQSFEHVRVQLASVALYTWSENRQERLFRVVEHRLLSPS